MLLKTALRKDTDVTGCCTYFNYPNGTEKSRASAQIDICDTRSLIKWMLEGGIDATTIGKDVAMQIAALNPRFWDKSQVSQDVLDEEKKIMMVQMENDPKMANKPEQVREKIVMGKMNKFYSENCLLQQEFVRGDVFTGSVEQYIADAAKKLGGKITFVDAIRFEKGEGIEKKQENFAEEIAKMVKG